MRDNQQKKTRSNVTYCLNYFLIYIPKRLGGKFTVKETKHFKIGIYETILSETVVNKCFIFHTVTYKFIRGLFYSL